MVKTFGCVRWYYNQALADAKETYERTGKSNIAYPTYYKKTYEWLKEVDSHALCNSRLHLQAAYNRFYDRLLNKGMAWLQAGFPKFKKRGQHASYTTNNRIPKQGKHDIRFENGGLKLPKLGFVKGVYHQFVSGLIKSVTVSRTKTGKFFVSILVEKEDKPVAHIIDKNKAVGLDMSMKDFYVDSEGERANYPHFYRKSEKRLIKAQRRLSKKKLGSHNREKAKLKVAKLHEKIANQRNDFLHNLSRHLVDRYDVIGVEDINLQAMSRCLRLEKSIGDNGFGEFRRQLDYKCRWAGKALVKVDRWFASSQTCSACGTKSAITKDLSVRSWACPDCGTVHDRDINAAINICKEAVRLISTSATDGSKACGEDYVTLHTSAISRKQEKLSSKHSEGASLAVFA
jgi:putative transposase